MSREVWSGILVYLEMNRGNIADVSLELLGKALELSEKNGEKIYGIAVVQPGETCDFFRELPLDELSVYEMKSEFQADVYEEAFVDCIEEYQPSVVLIGGTVQGRSLAARLAVAFRTGVTADCTALDIDEGGNLVQTRPAFGGNIMASILTAQTRPQIATVRPGVFEQVFLQNERSISVKRKNGTSKSKKARIEERREIQKKAGIEEQEILVVAGRGVQRREDLEMLRELAELLGGALASSRALVEKGWISHENQIGLSGKSVKPKCMLTFGVSGTVQFMAGMRNTPNIIAVNLDPKARIFEIAHYPVCADLYEVVPRMLELLKKKK